MTRAALSLAMVLLLSAAAAAAHDFWLEPSRFTPRPGDEITVRLKVGEHFKGDAVARDPNRIVSFVATGPDGQTPLEGAAGAEPAGRARLASPGLILLSYSNTPAYLELDAGKFESYLKEEGLDRIIALRKERGESHKRSRERYARCAKSLLAVGALPATAAGHDRVLGLTLELVPRANPYALPGGGPMEMDLLFRGKPLAEAEIAAIREQDPARVVTARTDAAGRARLSLDAPGVWLIKTVHMVEVSDPGADWESFWASLTFQVPAAR